AMTAITAVYAWFTQRTFIRKWLLFLCSVPLAVLGNIIRVLAISLVAQAFGQDVAMIFHDYSGFIFFPVSIALMLALGGLLNMDIKESWRNFKDKHLTPEEEEIDDGPPGTPA
ncbi:MAG: exosortase/archaeosortase family protein, partial [Verrucomicrobiota bacterium]